MGISAPFRITPTHMGVVSLPNPRFTAGQLPQNSINQLPCLLTLGVFYVKCCLYGTSIFHSAEKCLTVLFMLTFPPSAED